MLVRLSLAATLRQSLSGQGISRLIDFYFHHFMWESGIVKRDDTEHSRIHFSYQSDVVPFCSLQKILLRSKLPNVQCIVSTHNPRTLFLYLQNEITRVSLWGKTESGTW